MAIKSKPRTFSTGPGKVITTYAKVLEKHQLNPTEIKIGSNDETFKVAILGESFIICREVEFKRVL